MSSDSSNAAPNESADVLKRGQSIPVALGRATLCIADADGVRLVDSVSADETPHRTVVRSLPQEPGPA